MPFFVDAYLADTTHLSTEEHGAYLLLLMAMWRRGGGIPDDDKDNARMVGLTPRQWSAMKPRVVCFFARTPDGGWTQKRLQKEWEYLVHRRSVAQANGRLGGRPIANETNDLTKPEGLPQLKPDESSHTHTQLELPSGSSISKTTFSRPKAKKSRIAYSASFEEFWVTYPTDRIMSKSEAFKAWEALTDEDQALAMASVRVFKAYCSQHPDYRPVHAVRYLSQRRFESVAAFGEKEQARVLVKTGTPQWKAWETHWLATRGKRPPVDNDGWSFPSEWPPKTPEAA